MTMKPITDSCTLAESYLATALILMRDNKILCVLRSGTGYYDGYYALPGGKCDQGETILECSIREAYEELGVVVQEDALACIHVVHRNDETIKNWVLFFFVIDTWQGTLINKEPDKHSELAWFDIDEIPENLMPAHKHALKQWKNKQLCSVFDQNKQK
jgi:8-oxo-dGTP diphosphatase